MIRKIFRVLAVLCILTAFFYQAVYADRQHDSSRGTISATGTASESYPPDIVQITLSVETLERSVTQATEKNSRLSEKVITALKELTDEKKGDMISTSSYSIHPKYEYNRNNKKNIFMGYTVTNQITVKSGNIEAAGEIIDKAVEEGVNRVHNISFTISDKRAYCDELIDQAAKRGKSEAEIVARSLGTAITGIKSASSSCSDFTQQPPFARSFAMEAADSKSIPSIEPGAIKLTGTVNLVFFIDDKN